MKDPLCALFNFFLFYIFENEPCYFKESLKLLNYHILNLILCIAPYLYDRLQCKETGIGYRNL